MKIKDILFNFDRLDDLISAKRHYTQVNHKGQEMFTCFEPAIPFKDICLKFDHSRFFCKWCYKRHEMVDYIE